jgi:hypothetical protein
MRAQTTCIVQRPLRQGIPADDRGLVRQASGLIGLIARSPLSLLTPLHSLLAPCA